MRVRADLKTDQGDYVIYYSTDIHTFLTKVTNYKGMGIQYVQMLIQQE
jgi:hypothetical protein